MLAKTMLVALPFAHLGLALSDEVGLGPQVDADNGDNLALIYAEALQTPQFSNAVSFQGFNWSAPLGTTIDPGTTTNSTETWHLQLNYTQFATNDTESDNAVAGVTTFSLHFSEPGSQWDLQSNWQLCAGLLTDSFPDNISSKTGNNSDGSCAPYLGQQCVDDYTQAYLLSPRRTLSGTQGFGCPPTPALLEIDSCKKALSSMTNAGTSEAVITNTTAPDLIYTRSNSSFFSTNTGQNIPSSNITTQGLSSDQQFAWTQKSFSGDADNVNSSSTTEARRLRLWSFTIIPVPGFNTPEHSYEYNNNVRMICGRADTGGAREASVANSTSAAGPSSTTKTNGAGSAFWSGGLQAMLSLVSLAACCAVV